MNERLILSPTPYQQIYQQSANQCSQLDARTGQVLEDSKEGSHHGDRTSKTAVLVPPLSFCKRIPLRRDFNLSLTTIGTLERDFAAEARFGRSCCRTSRAGRARPLDRKVLGASRRRIADRLILHSVRAHSFAIAGVAQELGHISLRHVTDRAIRRARYMNGICG